MTLVTTDGWLWTVCSWLLILLLVLGLLLVIFTFVIKWHATGGKRFCHSKARLDGKTVLITGGNSGVGKETAFDLAGRGARVILGCRSKERAEAAVEEIKERSGNNDVLYHLIDLSDLDSVRSFAEVITQTERRLDILINNAGIGASPFQHIKTTKQGFEIVFGTNYLGPFLLTYLLTDLLEKSAPSQVVNTSSYAHYFVRKKLDFTPTESNGTKYPNLKDYPICSLAIVMHAREFAKRYKDKNIRENSVHPGFVDSNIWSAMKTSMPAFLYKAWKAFVRFCSLTCQEGAQTTICVAVDEQAQSENGSFFINCQTKPMNKLALDDTVCAQLWDVSMKMCDLK